MQQGAATPVVKTRVLQYSYYYATPDTLPVDGPGGRSMDDGAAMALIDFVKTYHGSELSRSLHGMPDCNPAFLCPVPLG